MTTKRFQDTRDEVDHIVHRHQLDYSLGQLRLVGLLLLAVALGSLLVALAFGGVDTPQARLAGLVGLTPALPLLPLGFSLYLLGGGHRRHRREQTWAPILHRIVLPAGLICLVILPAVTLHDGFSVIRQRQQVLRAQEARQIRDQRILERIRVAPSAAGEEKAISLWRYEMAQARRRQEIATAASRASLSAFQHEILSPVRLLTTLLVQLVSGAGLLLMRLQGRRHMKRVGLTPSLFFRTNATGPMRQERRSIDRK